MDVGLRTKGVLPETPSDLNYKRQQLGDATSGMGRKSMPIKEIGVGSEQPMLL
jgi:hypothetical protein